MRSKGIDVSEHQGVIDWAKVAKDGVQFAVIRAGYGRELSQKDKQFERNYAGAKAAGIKVGAYWYSYANSVERGEQEARACLKVLEGKRFELPIFFDQEYEKSILALSNKTRTDIVLKFLETVKGATAPNSTTPARSGRGSTPAKAEWQASRAMWITITGILRSPTPPAPTCSARATGATTSNCSNTG